jgi:hypothetical protein
MDDAQLVEKVARDFLDWFGGEAVNVLRDRAEQATGEGDAVSEQAWRDIADAAARIVAGSGSAIN